VLSFQRRLGGSTFDKVVRRGLGTGVEFDVDYNLNDVAVRVVAVPEPTTYLLMLCGLGAVIVTVSRRRNVAVTETSGLASDSRH